MPTDAGGPADRTQVPSGAGYALENRQIVSRALPELYRDLRVQHLAGYFRTLQETLASQAAGDGETPLVVLLTPGRFNETYFEHLYLARQLGFPLVEGHDLTVRDATPYLKTLGGLKRVHAVLRRLDDDFCDPLELRTDSALGIPGLLEAVRQGRAGGQRTGQRSAGVARPARLPAAGLSPPAWRGTGAALARHPLVRRAASPSAILAALPDLVIKPAFPGQRCEPLFGHALDSAGLASLGERFARAPAGLRGATPGAVVPGTGLARRQGRRRPAVAGHRHAPSPPATAATG